jgi:hypothetical protein
MNSHIQLEHDQIQLLDQALRVAYTRLIDTGAVRGYEFQHLRDPLIAPMIAVILKGERDVWRIARPGLFVACELLAHGKLSGPASQSAAA